MFQLDNAIENWKSGLLANQNMTDGNVNELESHLRDEIDSLMLSGLSDQEAFMVSTHRIGDRQTIGREFAKVNPSLAWQRRAFWMFFGILVSMVVTGFANVCSTASAALLAWLKVDAAISGAASVVVHIGVYLVLLFTLIFALGFFVRRIKHRLSVVTVFVSCLITIALLKITSVILTMLKVNLLDIQSMRELSIVAHYTSFAWSILWPVIVVVMLFTLRSSRPYRVQ